MNILTIGSEYHGSMNLYGCGIRNADLFENTIKEKIGDNISQLISLRGYECTSNKITSSIQEIISNGNKTIIYVFCHGNCKVIDHHLIELWEPPSGEAINQIKMANILNSIPTNYPVILFSESCDSNHMINSLIMKKRYLSIGATAEHQDAIITCEGGLFSLALIDSIRELNHDSTLEDLINHISSKTVDIEKFSIKYSDSEVLSELIFK